MQSAHLKPKNQFTTWIGQTQQQWAAWVTTERRLEGAVTMGTAGADVEETCLQDAYASRIRALDDMTRYLSAGFQR